MPEEPDALDRLRQTLAHLLAGRPRQLGWSDPTLLSERIARLRQRFAQRRGMAEEQRIARGVMAFRLLGRQTGFVHLKYACAGLALPVDWESRRLIEDAQERETLFACVAALRTDPRRFAACYRNLESAWQRAAAAAPHIPELAMLRQFLDTHRPTDTRSGKNHDRMA
jgi:hypothetical protein